MRKAIVIVIVLGLPFLVLGAADALLVTVSIGTWPVVRAIARRVGRRTPRWPARPGGPETAAATHPPLPFPASAPGATGH
jgi:hypothetical protein